MKFTKTKILSILLLNTGLTFAQSTIDIQNISGANLSGISLISPKSTLIFSRPADITIRNNELAKVKFEARAYDGNKYILVAIDPITKQETVVLYDNQRPAKPVAIVNNQDATYPTFITITVQSQFGIFATCVSSGNECSTLTPAPVPTPKPKN